MLRPKKEERRRSRSSRQRSALSYYHSAEPEPKSPFAANKKNKFRFRKLVIGVTDIAIIIILILGLVYSLIIRPDSSIKAADYYRSTAVYKGDADAQLKSIKNRSKILVDQQQLINSLIDKYPEIASGSVELPIFSQKPSFNLNISPPAFYLSSSSKNYLVNQQGVVVGEASDFDSIRNLVSVTDQSGFSPQRGKQVISAGGAVFITQLIAYCRQSKVPIKSLILPPKAQELDLQTADRGYYIKFILNADSGQQVGQFLAARHEFDQTGNQPAEYLDVRVLGKIFYK